MANGILIVDKPEGWTSQDVVSMKNGSVTVAPWTLWQPAFYLCS